MYKIPKLNKNVYRWSKQAKRIPRNYGSPALNPITPSPKVKRSSFLPNSLQAINSQPPLKTVRWTPGYLLHQRQECYNIVLVGKRTKKFKTKSIYLFNLMIIFSKPPTQCSPTLSTCQFRVRAALHDNCQTCRSILPEAQWLKYEAPAWFWPHIIGSGKVFLSSCSGSFLFLPHSNCLT